MKSILTLAVALLMLLTLALPVYPGSLPMVNRYSRSWTSKDGLKGSQVWTILQDGSGYLWLGTNEGLVRFDGISFRVWPAFGSVSLPNGSVRALALARDGTMWIGFGGIGGVSRVRGGELRNYSSLDGLPRAIVLSVLEDHAGVAWAVTVLGLYRLSNDRWTAVTDQQGLPQGAISSMYEDRRGDLWVGTSNGTYRCFAAGAQFAQVGDTGLIDGFAEDHAGTVWGVGSQGLFRFGAGAVKSWPTLAGTRIHHDGDGRLWLATLGDGLLYVDPTSAGPILYRYRGKAVLTSDVVRAVVEDREGNLWLGTQSGLNRLSEAVVSMFADDGLGPLARAVITTADGAVWMATSAGLYRLKHGTTRRFTEVDGLPSASIRALHETPTGTLWVATTGGIARATPAGFETMPRTPGLRLAQIMAITTDRTGALWVGDLTEGLIRFQDGMAKVMVDARVARPFSVSADARGRIWTGFADGTLTIHDGDHVQTLSEQNGFAGGMITSLREEPQETMWVGSSKGLFRLRAGQIDHLPWSSGLPGNVIGAILPDGLGNLWLASSSGIIRLPLAEIEKGFHDRTYRVRHVLYDASDGLRGDPIGFGAPTAAQADDGMLWFITSDGIARLHVRYAEKKRLPPPVVIENIVADLQQISPQDGAVLAPHTGNVQINYAGLSLRAPEKVTFQYLMEGFDKQWVDAGTRRQAFYTNLPPGHYRFRVKADNDGAPNETEAVWAFRIAPDFYQTGWFALAMVVAAAALATGAWRLRVRSVRSKFALILVERSRMAREIHDTLLQSLLGVMLRLDDVEKTVDVSADSAKQQLGRLRQQVEFYIREARHSIRDLRSPTLQTRDLACALEEMGLQLTGGRALFRFSAAGRMRRFPARVEQNLLRIAQEAISNALRHGAPRTIAVRITYSAGTLSLHVSDDGCGFDPGAMNGCGDHWGIASMHERAAQIQARLLLTSQPGAGTEVDVRVPVPSG